MLKGILSHSTRGVRGLLIKYIPTDDESDEFKDKQNDYWKHT